MQNADVRQVAAVVNDENEKYTVGQVNEAAASYCESPNGKDARTVLSYLATRIHGDVSRVLTDAADLIGKYNPPEKEETDEKPKTNGKRK